MSINKSALKEALLDTGIGTIINIPITWASIAFGFYVDMSISEFTVFQTVIFSVVGITRKYHVRNHFENKG